MQLDLIMLLQIYLQTHLGTIISSDYLGDQKITTLKNKRETMAHIYLSIIRSAVVLVFLSYSFVVCISSPPLRHNVLY